MPNRIHHFIASRSENIFSIGYDRDAFVLEVIFKGATHLLYRYRGVFHDTYVRLMTADSLGAEFHKLIKDNKEFTKEAVSPELRRELRLGGG